MSIFREIDVYEKTPIYTPKLKIYADINFFDQINKLKDWLDETMDNGDIKKGKKIYKAMHNIANTWIKKNKRYVLSGHELQIWEKVFCGRYCPEV